MSSARIFITDKNAVCYISLIDHRRASPAYRFITVILNKAALDPSAYDRGVYVVFTTCLSYADPNSLESGELLKVRLLITRQIRTDVLITH